MARAASGRTAAGRAVTPSAVAAAGARSTRIPRTVRTAGSKRPTPVVGVAAMTVVIVGAPGSATRVRGPAVTGGDGRRTSRDEAMTRRRTRPQTDSAEIERTAVTGSAGTALVAAPGGPERTHRALRATRVAGRATTRAGRAVVARTARGPTTVRVRMALEAVAPDRVARDPAVHDRAEGAPVEAARVPAVRVMVVTAQPAGNRRGTRRVVGRTRVVVGRRLTMTRSSVGHVARSLRLTRARAPSVGRRGRRTRRALVGTTGRRRVAMPPRVGRVRAGRRRVIAATGPGRRGGPGRVRAVRVVSVGRRRRIRSSTTSGGRSGGDRSS